MTFLQGQQPFYALLHQLRAILQSIPILESQGYKPPIIDGDGASFSQRNGDTIMGLRIFKNAVCREVEILEQVRVMFYFILLSFVLLV